MSTHAVTVVRLHISDHPGADRLELAKVGGYLAVVAKGQFHTGDLAAYIPEDSLIPDPILHELGLHGKLAGSQANRVKAMRLRGILSQGLVYPARAGWKEGQDVTEELGISKYMPPVPVSMSGSVWVAGSHRTVNYDIENIKRFPDVLKAGEMVRVTEKIHGSACFIGMLSEQDADPVHGRLVISSKGLGSKGIAFDLTAAPPNIYVRAARQGQLEEKLADVAKDRSLFVCGEVFGHGVQDLKYGANARAQGQLGFRVFDVHLGSQSDPEGRWMNHDELEAFLQRFDIPGVPLLYVGPYCAQKIQALTSGKETLSGTEEHLREGVVVRPVTERRELELGRVQLKSVSEAYLLRKGGTEYQ